MAEEKKQEDKPKNSLQERLLKARVVTIFGEIDMDLAEKVCAQLLALAAESDDDIRVLVNSPGGHVESGDTIHDMIRFIKPKVTIIGTGWVVSAATLIYVAVPKEQRVCLPNTRFLIHQPLGGARGPASDLEIHTDQILKTRARINRMLAEATGQPLERVEKDTLRDFWLTAQEAIEYGLPGRIIESVSDLD